MFERDGIARRIARDESGASAVITAIVLPVLLGCVVLAVDAGNLWQTRRDIISATDAAVLAEANRAVEEAAVGPGNCSPQWDDADDFLEVNADQTTSGASCTRVLTPDSTGYVAVRASERADLFFAPAIGFGDETSVYSMSAATISYPNGATGLAPLTFCIEDPHLSSVHLAATPAPDPADAGDYTLGDGTVVHRFWFDNTPLPDCGEANGNWGWLDFDPSGGGSNEIWERLLNGYWGDTVLHYGDWTGSQTGGRGGTSSDSCASRVNSTTEALDCLIQTGQTIAVVVHDDSRDCDRGDLCEYQAESFMGVRLHCYNLDNQLDGPQDWCYQRTGSDDNIDWMTTNVTPRPEHAKAYFDFEIVERFTLRGGAGGPRPTHDFGARVVTLCSFDRDLAAGLPINETVSLANRCAVPVT